MHGTNYECFQDDGVINISQLELSRFEFGNIISALQYYTTKKGLSYGAIEDTVMLERQLRSIYKTEPVQINKLTEVPII